MKATQTRKEFLRLMATGIGIAMVSPLIAKNNIFKDDIYTLSQEQKELLVVYKEWLKGFNSFIDDQKRDFTSAENNKKLMQLSAEAEQWKSQMAEFMNDEHFAAYYKLIIEETSNKIA